MDIVSIERVNISTAEKRKPATNDNCRVQKHNGKQMTYVRQKKL